MNLSFKMILCDKIIDKDECYNNISLFQNQSPLRVVLLVVLPAELEAVRGLTFTLAVPLLWLKSNEKTTSNGLLGTPEG